MFNNPVLHNMPKYYEIHPIRIFIPSFFFASKREPRYSGVKNVPYVKENVNIRCRRVMKIVVTHGVGNSPSPWATD